MCKQVMPKNLNTEDAEFAERTKGEDRFAGDLYVGVA